MLSVDPASGCAALKGFLERHCADAAGHDLRRALDVLPPDPANRIARLVGLYEQALPLLEQALARSAFADDVIRLYQDVYQELEAFTASGGTDRRYRFVVVIPVADRPRHLETCLESLLTLCRSFGYGGMENGRYRGVQALIADDSALPASIQRNRALAERFDRSGLEVTYFGLDEQLAQLDRMTERDRVRLTGILGDLDRSDFSRKGPSIMRNIVYLKLNEMAAADARQLFYFVDSDQEFRVRVAGPAGDRELYAVNYFYWLDRIFSASDIRLLTGKVVGDPPVSPAVMAGTLLDDVIGFLERLRGLRPDAPCQFHNSRQAVDAGAAYHDMAGLFGFQSTRPVYDYGCTLEGAHDHAACLEVFARRLSRFFDGEHPTRLTYYSSAADPSTVKPARTVYTGNYVLRPDALKYFVPFAPLKLRMAGPVLGRIVRAELGEGFVSANLPLLHRRTVVTTGEAEFRPGVDKSARTIDLSGEFERQFFGDVMLFTVDRLTSMGYPGADRSPEEIEQALLETEATMCRLYDDKHAQILLKLARVRAMFAEADAWWNGPAADAGTRQRMQAFIVNMERNFGAQSECYRLIAAADNRQRRREQIRAALLQYRSDRAAWVALLNRVSGPV